MMGGVYSDGEMGLKCQAPVDRVGYTLAEHRAESDGSLVVRQDLSRSYADSRTAGASLA